MKVDGNSLRPALSYCRLGWLTFWLLGLAGSLLVSEVHGAALVLVPQQYGTIQSAIAAAVEGDRIVVAPGTYHESLDFCGKAIEVVSQQGPLRTTITNSPTSNLVHFHNHETNRSVLEGFTLRGGWCGIVCTDAAPTIRYNILVAQHVHNWAALVLGGAVCDSAASVGPAGAVIVNNTIIGCVNGGISTFSSEVPTIHNNLIVSNGGYGIHREGLLIGVAQPDLAYNLVFDNPVAFYEICEPGPGTLMDDPLLTPDYRLGDDSPCIDAGDPDVLYNDADGSPSDIGAVPWQIKAFVSRCLYVAAGAVGDVADGSAELPFPYIGQAIAAGEHGDVVLVEPGIYRETLDFGGKLLEVRSLEGPQRTVITSAPDSTLVTFQNHETSKAILHGFTLQGGLIGVHCANAGPTIRYNILINQTITNWAAIVLSGSADPTVITTGRSPAVIVNNTIIGAANGGISTFSTAAPVIRNNIIVDNGHYGIHREGIIPGVALPDVGYNLIHGQPIPFYELPDGGPGCLLEDPCLAADLSLRTGSPCVGAGDPAPHFNKPNAKALDLGAVPLGWQPN